MNYRHGFHAGNHADVLKHLVLIALLDALKRKEAAFFVLDTHAGRGRYDLTGGQATKTGEAKSGIRKVWAAKATGPSALASFLKAVEASQAGAPDSYPGSPLLVSQALRPQDRFAACEVVADEAAALKALLAGDPRSHVHHRDGYAAIKAMLPPKDGAIRFGRALVLVDPPYEAQEAEYPLIVAAVGDALLRFPQAMFAIWYPIKQRPSLHPFFRKMSALPAKSMLAVELLVRPDDSPLRMNGSGLVIVNAPWKLDEALAPALAALAGAIGGKGASSRVQWLHGPE